MLFRSNPENRHGIILAKNKIAKKFGVLTAETIYQAVKKCPELVLLPPHHEKYTYFYHKTNEIYRRYTDLVEPFSIDESWLDLTASTKLFGTGEEIARDSFADQAGREVAANSFSPLHHQTHKIATRTV